MQWKKRCSQILLHMEKIRIVLVFHRHCRKLTKLKANYL
jgi:hypothetical protein